MELTQIKGDRLVPRAACRLKHAATQHAAHSTQRGFTLVELLVTTALVTVLMLACAQVFSIASKTIGGGQAIGAAVRDAQAAQAVFARDFAAVASPQSSPYFYIISHAQRAHRNANDARVDPTVANFDFDQDGTEEDISGATYNFRNHRLDTMAFFAIDRFARQTGSGTTLSVDDASREAWIWYGHLSIANNAATPVYFRPGDTAAGNDNNQYATQWTLGRVAMLLDQTPTVANGFVARVPASPPNLTPLAFLPSSGTNGNIQFRYDVAQSSISDYKADLNDYIASGGTAWINRCGFDNVAGTSIGRFQVNPFPSRPLTPASASSIVPMFVPACTQFIVEFAGDFVIQNWDPSGNGTPDEPVDVADPAYGRVIGGGQDNRIDSVYTTRWTGQTRWYGAPRDTNGNGIISSADGDVAPVRDLGVGTPAWERWATTPPTGTRIYGEPTFNFGDPYAAFWGPADINRPKMIRITLVIDRPEAEGRLLDGQSFEYVFNVGY
jgi:prepilin-type N-terminal cleavage/methylation domain-containing protein